MTPRRSRSASPTPPGCPPSPTTRPTPIRAALRFDSISPSMCTPTSSATRRTAFLPATATEFLEFLRAAAASGPDVPSPKPIEQFLGSHPAASAFVQAPKPFPVSLARETYYGVTAFRFINAPGETNWPLSHRSRGGQRVSSPMPGGRTRRRLPLRRTRGTRRKGPSASKFLCRLPQTDDVLTTPPSTGRK